MRSPVFFIVAMLVGLAGFVCALWIGNDYFFYAGFVVLQFIVLATAWNILGGYCGYVNFGSAGFFAVGAYSTVTLHTLAQTPNGTLSGRAVAGGGRIFSRCRFPCSS